jgi:hypothetical protein
MPWTKLEFKPGVIKDRTRYSGYGYWYDSSLVRFRNGLPEAWAGWENLNSDFEFQGICRSFNRFADNDGFSWVGVGTNSNFYMISDDIDYDVTPIASTSNLGTDPVATVDGSTTVTITDTAHDRFPGSSVVLSGLTATGGVPAGDLNKEHIVVSFISDNEYTIEVDTAATSTTSGGGSSGTADNVFYAGSVNQIYGGGWGYYGWGNEEWGGNPDDADSDRAGLWSHDNWGEDLVACARGGPIFYWDKTTPSARMVGIQDLAGADGNAPAYAEFIVTSHRDRHLLAFGTEEYSTGNFSPMTVRWCDQENILDWDESDTTGTAGSIPLSKGSRLISAISTQREVIVWSDQALYSMQYVGAPYIYVIEMIEGNSDILGLNARCVSDSTVYWMGRTGIYLYDGRVRKVNCPVWDHVKSNIDLLQSDKVFVTSNRLYNEILFFYPGLPSNADDDDVAEILYYVSYNVTDETWAVGTLVRTAWLEGNALNNPIAAGTDGAIYEHEVGASDGSTTPATAIDAYVESAPFELSSEGSYDRGDRMMFIRRIIPDVTFREYDNNVDTPSMNIVLKMMDKPGGGFDDTSSSQVTSTAILPVETFTDDIHIRLRGRSLTVRYETNSAGARWRAGTPRIDVRPDGQRGS